MKYLTPTATEPTCSPDYKAACATVRNHIYRVFCPGRTISFNNIIRERTGIGSIYTVRFNRVFLLGYHRAGKGQSCHKCRPHCFIAQYTARYYNPVQLVGTGCYAVQGTELPVSRRRSCG